MKAWPRWRRQGEPAALARYVLPDRVGQLLTLPGPSAAPPRDRLRAIHDALAQTGITYALEVPSDEADRQIIRTPDEVLRFPRHATCLDLALVAAGACLKAGLHAVVVVLASRDAGGAAHALVAVWSPRGPDERYPFDAEVLDAQQQAALRDQLHHADRPTGAFLAFDPSLLAGPAGQPGFTPPAFEDGLAAASARLREAEWETAVDVGLGYRTADALQAPLSPVNAPIREGYFKFEPDMGPLSAIRADYGLVPFQPTGEFEGLLEWFTAESPRRVRLAVVHGIGGAGKTRTAMELADRLRQRGWYAGLLASDADVAWLGTVASPLLVVIDYADGHPTSALAACIRTLANKPGAPASIVLTARTADAWWNDLQQTLESERVLAETRVRLLPDRPQRPERLFRRAYGAFRARLAPGAPPSAPPLPRGEWSTLDVVLMAWLATRDGHEQPPTRDHLYDTVLTHERRYWKSTLAARYGHAAVPSDDALDAAAATVTLVAPSSIEVDHLLDLLSVVPEIAEASARDRVRDTLVRCLATTAREGLAVRPDPVGDHLWMRVFAARPKLFVALLRIAQPEERTRALAHAARAGRQAPLPVRKLVDTALAELPHLWQPAFPVAAQSGGPLLGALEALAARPDTPLPVEEIATSIPPGHATLRRLALIVTQAVFARCESEGSDKTRLAGWLNNLATRQSAVGQRHEALASITRAVEIYVQLAQDNPAAFRPDLAMSLNNLANRQSEVGQRHEALASITRAVEIREQLAQDNPAAFRPYLAMSLNNLATLQSEVGQRHEALASIARAVEIREQLAQDNPVAFRPYLATSLSNLANLQSGVGQRHEALASITRAVEIREQLAQDNPAAFRPDLAMSLNNLANHQSEVGQRHEALASITRAVEIREQLAQDNPAAFRPDLAMSLNNLATLQSDVGQRHEALASITRAVEIYEQLAQDNPPAFRPYLATSLNNLANRQSEVGQRHEALASITRAVEIREQLAQDNPAAFRPYLAMSLNNLANRQSEVGQRHEALASITRAVEIYEQLAQDNPAAFRPDLATSLNNLAIRQSEVGQRHEALASITRAVEIYEQLAQDNPAAFRPYLAMSLNNLANRQSEVGQRHEALASITRAVEIYEQLAQDNPTAFRPDLATSLNNLAIRQSEVGQRHEALASITRAVEIREQLAQDNPAAFRPDLAMSLNNLANHQSEVGQRHEALASITRAVEIREQLAQDNPAAFKPSLATSLNNLAIRQSEVGQRHEALASITRAVEIREQLAQDNPAVFRPDLAMSLNNLANHQSEVGQRHEALASITRAAEIYEQLAQDNPAAFRPDLATSLNNLANLQFEVGRRHEALASITRAVEIREQLAQDNPAAFRPDLAISLNNLANRQSEVGQRHEALASITRAVEIYEQLAQDNPAAFLSNLMTSLNNFARLLSDGDDVAGALQAFDTSSSRMEHSCTRALLGVTKARWRAERGDTAGAAQDLARATTLVQGDHDDHRLLGEARCAIRAAVQDLAQGAEAPPDLGDLPTWATATLDDSHVALVNTWARCPSWPEEAAFLEQHQEELRSPAFAQSLDLLGYLYPGDATLARCAAVLQRVQEIGFAAFMAERTAQHEATSLLNEWIATPTWDASRVFLEAQRERLQAPETMAPLAASAANAPVARQHLAILLLSTTHSLDDVYDIVIEPAAAVDAVMAAIEQGLPDTLALLLGAQPVLGRDPFMAPLVRAVLALLGDGTDDADAHAQRAAENADATQRQAAALRLRRLARARPDVASGADRLAALFEAEPS